MDTDVFVAALRSSTGASRQWLLDALERRHRLLLTVPLVFQYEEVVTRPSQLAAIGGSANDVTSVIDAMCAVSEALSVSYLWRPMLRDPDEEMVLEAAVQGRADVLLTFNERDFAGAESLGVRVLRPGPARKLLRGILRGKQS